ncbi:ankyrin repeat domain-containing protein [uncultured Draconibacterium sp.]|uniref:ankyrin repeat domain-containing protein n=1 Tax=uncultured Draconibacterium sp. TaxID=1573823 RepID=UPI003216504C
MPNKKSYNQIFSTNYKRYEKLFSAIKVKSYNSTLSLLKTNRFRKPLDINLNHVNPFSRYNETPLIEAINKSDFNIVKLLVDYGADVNKCLEGSVKKTPLTEAIEKGGEEITEFLINRGADVNCQNSWGKTPLELVSEKGWIKIVQLLLDKGAEVNCTKENYSPSLLKASSEGHLEIVKTLISKGAKINGKSLVFTALIESVSKGHFEIVKELVEHGADINKIIKVKFRDGEEDNALISAIQNGHEDIALFLIEKGAEINIKINKYTYPLILASQKGFVKIVEKLIENGALLDEINENGSTALIESITFDNFEIAKLLILNGADVNIKATDEEGEYNALCISSAKGKTDIVSLLLNHSANVNIDNSYGETPLTLATEFNHIEVVKLLIENGADINKKNHNNICPLLRASIEGNKSIMSYLMKSGGKFLKEPEEYNLPLLEVAEKELWTPTNKEHVKAIGFLIEMGANINAKDKDGNSPLHIATSCPRNNKIISELLKYGADINSKNNEGVTPLMNAIQWNKYKTVKNLIKHGANVNDKNIDDTSVLDLARDNKKVFELLLKNGANPNI